MKKIKQGKEIQNVGLWKEETMFYSGSPRS